MGRGPTGGPRRVTAAQTGRCPLAKNLFNLPIMSEPKKEKAYTGPLVIFIGIVMIARGIIGRVEGLSFLFLLLGMVNIGVGIYLIFKYNKQKKRDQEEHLD